MIWPPLAPDTIVLVAGLGRCGTSLLMQMLDAGGFPCWGSWPDYEGDLQLDPSNPEWTRQARGRAIKAIDPHRWAPPAGQDYRIFWLDRHRHEQAASQLSMIRPDQPITRNERRQMVKLLDRDTAAAQRVLLGLDSPDVVGLRFEDLIGRTDVAAREISNRLGGTLDVNAMVRQVVPRSPACSHGLVEAQLVNLGRAA